jgi:hypothetical protein
MHNKIFTYRVAKKKNEYTLYSFFKMSKCAHFLGQSVALVKFWAFVGVGGSLCCA